MTDKEKEYERERYEWYKSHGICVRCLTEKAKEGHVVCWRCLANENDYSRIYYHKNPRSDEQRAKDKESRERYVEEQFKRLMLAVWLASTNRPGQIFSMPCMR